MSWSYKHNLQYHFFFLQNQELFYRCKFQYINILNSEFLDPTGNNPISLTAELLNSNREPKS